MPPPRQSQRRSNRSIFDGCHPARPEERRERSEGSQRGSLLAALLPIELSFALRRRMSMLPKLTYAIKFVADMDRAVRFHRDTLGLPLKFQSPGWSEFATGDTTLALHPASEKNPARQSGVGFPGRRSPEISSGHARPGPDFLDAARQAGIRRLSGAICRFRRRSLQRERRVASRSRKRAFLVSMQDQRGVTIQAAANNIRAGCAR
jgi:catechol 2,3-dioxygenase-like lactoylglutathione lyase family enzyme